MLAFLHFSGLRTKQSALKTKLLRSLRSLAMIGKILLLAMTLLFGCSKASSSKVGAPNILLPQFEGTVHAPEFPTGVAWLNVKKPISVADLKGKIVLLDFWTYCCINCIHVIPDLKKLEEKYSDELVVIGVHSGKFENEKNIDPIRQAVLRYEIKHPVVNDKHYEIWNSYGIHAWPSFVLLNPQGRIIGTHSGEGIYELFDAVIQKAAKYFDEKGELKKGIFETYPEVMKDPNSSLLFPGKIHATNEGKLFISDSGYNRIVIVNLQGEVLDRIGSGQIGSADGSFEQASFNHPQGLYEHEGILYLADTDNHAIRRAELKSRRVTTLFRDLNSPWDLVFHQNKLYIAMAGSHQLWRADLATHEIRPFAGSGREARIDGPLNQAALAQPSGIDTDGRKLFFADSEVSSIRQADIDPKGNVETLVGRDLFIFGDKDGKGEEALLQHPLGVSFYEGKLFVADTYNSKIKILDPNTRESKTFSGTGKHGKENGERLQSTFNEPGGLDVLKGVLYIADTNNHLIRTLDLKTEQVGTLDLRNLNPPVILGEASEILRPALDGPQDDSQTPQADVIQLTPIQLPSGESRILIHIHLPQGHDYTAQAPSRIQWRVEPPESLHLLNEESQADPSESQGLIRLDVLSNSGAGKLLLDATIYFCHEKSKICFFDQIHARAPFQIMDGAPSEVSVNLDVNLPS